MAEHKILGVIHAVTYSIMLLNTDLHVADLATHMSRSQFVRNTMTAIQAQFPSTIAHDQDGNSNMSRNTLFEDTEMVGRSKRSDSIASWNSVSRDVVISLSPSPSINRSSVIGETGSTSTPGVDTKPINTSHLYNRTWENEMENLLKVCRAFPPLPSQHCFCPRKCMALSEHNKYYNQRMRARRG
jgi:PH/SEC7 domain-containing protein